jgi:hypothetical protein
MSGYEAVGFLDPTLRRQQLETWSWRAEVCARELCKELADTSEYRPSAYIVTVLAAGLRA